jgi:hypothetical protein
VIGSVARGLGLVLACACAGPAAADSIHLYSYDAADQATRDAVGPLTFQVRKGLLHTTVMNMRSTEAEATVDLRPASDRSLGAGGVTAVVGARTGERDLYEVGRADQGAELIAVLCPGASRAWVALGKVRLDQDLKVDVIGEARGAKPRLCHRLAYSFHGEWRVPDTNVVLREKDLPHGRFPGT